MLLPDCPHAPGLLVGIDRESDQVHTGNAVYGGKCEAARILTAHEKGCLGCVLNADGIPPPRLDVQGRGPGGVRSLKSPQLPCSCQTIHPIRELLQVSMSRSERSSDLRIAASPLRRPMGPWGGKVEACVDRTTLEWMIVDK